MKSEPGLVNGLIIGTLVLLFGGIGFSIGNSTIGEYNPPWTHYPIQNVPKDVNDIVYVDIRSTIEDPTGDILFVATKNGEVYSNTLFQGDWLLVEPNPIWDDNSITECAAEWPGPTDAYMWDPPPVEKEVLDSAGARFERPVSIIARCYVLSNDGSLAVWIHSGNAMDSLASEIVKTVYVMVGVIFGVIIGIIIVYFRKKAERPTT